MFVDPSLIVNSNFIDICVELKRENRWNIWRDFCGEHIGSTQSEIKCVNECQMETEMRWEKNQWINGIKMKEKQKRSS